MWQRWMSTFLHGKGQLLWDVTKNTAYVHTINFLAPGPRDLHNANNRAVDYLFRALCQSEFDHVCAEDLACRIWDKLKLVHASNNQVKARLFATYHMEYENFNHLPSESIDTMFQGFTMIANNVRVNVTVCFRMMTMTEL
jgi:hypothetical protein